MNACQGASAKVSPGPLALGVPQEAEEVDRMAGRREIEAQAARAAPSRDRRDGARRPGGPGGWPGSAPSVTDLRVGRHRIVPAAGSSHGRAPGTRSNGSSGGRAAGADAAARGGRHAELGGDAAHDLDLLVGDRDVGALHRIAVGRLDHGAVALDRGHRLDPQRMRLAVGGEHAAVEPVSSPSSPAPSPGASIPSWPRRRGRRGRWARFGAGLGSASFRRRLPGLPRSRTTLLGSGLRPRIGVSPSKYRPDDHHPRASHRWRWKSTRRIARSARYSSG